MQVGPPRFELGTFAMSRQNPGSCTSSASSNVAGNCEDFLREFEKACRIDMRLNEKTIWERMRHARRLVEFLEKHPALASREELREFLEQNPRQNAIKTVRIIYGRFFESDIAKCFKVPQSPFRPLRVPTHEQLKAVYRKLPTLELRTAFLLFASSGLRLHEVAELTVDQIGLKDRMIFPKDTKEESRTKRQWITLFNEEAALVLVRHIRGKASNGRIFPKWPYTLCRGFKRASAKVGLKITPQVLREWFACELATLSVPDRYVDALCGRVPRSVLARHYTDYSPERLKAIYDKAELKVLS
jgi:integrase